MSSATAAARAARAALPPDERAAAVAALRDAQVSRALARAAAALAPKCAYCALLSRFCACAPWAWARARLRGGRGAPFAVTALVAPREIARGNSTHRLLAAALGADVVVARGEAGAAAAWGALEARAAAAGEELFVLFPSPDALTPRAARAALARGARARLVVLEGRWREARALAGALPPRARLVALPTGAGAPASLFQPCRVQPAPGALATAEAVAAAADAWGEAEGEERAEAGAGARGAGGDAAAADDAAAAAAAAATAAAAVAHFTGDTLRGALRAFVDRHVRQANMLGVGAHARGAGYRAFELGAGAGPFLGRLPATFLVAVAELAYGPARGFAPSGYAARARWAPPARRDAGAELRARAAALPLPARATASPLARASRALYFLAAGSWHLEHVRRRAPRPRARGGEGAGGGGTGAGEGGGEGGGECGCGGECGGGGEGGGDDGAAAASGEEDAAAASGDEGAAAASGDEGARGDVDGAAAR